jgi:hypothetical protein
MLFKFTRWEGCRMSIASRQATKQVESIVEERMKDGFIPTVDYINAKLGEFYSQYSVGFPFFKNRQMGYRKIFDINAYNDNLSEIYQDLNNLYEELVSQFTAVLTSFDYYETSRHKILHSIMSLEDTLLDLTLTSADTEGYIYSVHDSFIDRSKIDLAHTTCEVNTDAGIVTIREGKSGIVKIDMSHYYDVINFPILATEAYAKNIISNTVFPSSKFGYAFSSANATWAQNIVTKVPGKLEVSFIVNVSPTSDVGVRMTRIEMYSQSPGGMKITPLISNDNINFVSIPMGVTTSGGMVSDVRVTVWNFQEAQVNYVKFLIVKDVEDEQTSVNGVPAYRYVIGFKDISFYRMGYDISSELYSSAYVITDPTNESMTIDKASLSVDQDVQAGTSVRYFLSLGSSTSDDPTAYNWAPISPYNVPDQSEQTVVDFRQVSFFNNVPDIVWDVSSYGTKLESYYGIDFYQIYKFPYEPIRDSVVLYRGKNNWQVTPTYNVARIAIFDEKHVFGSSDSVTITNPSFTPVAGDGLIRGSVRVKTDPGQNPSYWDTIPGDYTVAYSTKVVTRTVGSAISSDPGNSSNTVYVDYQYDNEISQPTVYTTYVYINNQDGVSINHVPFNQAETAAGQFTKITIGSTEVDVSYSTTIFFSSGWHKVTTTARPQSASDRFYAVNGNKYLQSMVYQMFAFSDKLQETSWFDLKYNTLKTDHKKYAITDYNNDGSKEIIVNYRPQTSVFNISSTPWSDLLCADSTPEVYVISYKYITNATNKIFLRATLSRTTDTPATSTPTIREYTIKLGY